jgi:hypothetical protein
MKCNKMDDFINKATAHSAICGQCLKLTVRDTVQGAGVKEVWMCPVCHACLELFNCDLVKTEVVEDGRKWSRRQFEVNLRMASTFTSGVGMTKALEALNKNLGVKTAHYRNLLHTNQKVRGSVSIVAKERIIENRKEHVLRTRESEGYGGDVVWEKDGAVYSTSAGTHCADGAGCNRAYNNRVKSTQSCLVANSGITQKPIALIHSQVSSCVYLKYKDT